VAFFIPYNKETKKVLLVHHKKSNWWIFPGGHVEIDELPYDAVKRECLEELGIQANFLLEHPFFITETQTVGDHAGHTDISIGYLLTCDEKKLLYINKDEFNTIQWYNFDDIPYEQSDPAMERLINKLRISL
jgi:8-oxo-dGTP pyrophosphatase MutT (NUDIX family)